MGNYTSKGAAKLVLMLTIRKDDDDDDGGGEMKWKQKTFKKIVKNLSSIFDYIKRYGLWLWILIMLFNFEY